MPGEPLVSIGMPVFNGEPYLEEALDSILGQTLPDFELIISDNASADATADICRSYAARDRRIHYHRSSRNLGAAWNFNRVFRLSRGRFFKWASYDDLHAPQYLERCVGALEDDGRAVLAYARSRLIDEQGKVVRDYDVEFRSQSPRAHERFYDLISRDYLACQLYGVIRAEALRLTPLILPYASSDINLLAELALCGPFREIPERLFYRRDHAQRSVRAYPGRRENNAWFKPDGALDQRFAKGRRLFRYVDSIRRAPLTARERALCYLALARGVGARGRVAIRRGLERLATHRDLRAHHR